MTTTVAINGFGRIGRSVYRILSQRKDIKVAVINDIAPNESLAYLFKYDTVMGTYPGEVRMDVNSRQDPHAAKPVLKITMQITDTRQEGRLRRTAQRTQMLKPY